MLTEAKTYDELTRNFRWDIPTRFNMADACCDRHADGTGRLALVYVDENGATTRTSFDDVAEASRRFAGKEPRWLLGLRRLDPHRLQCFQHLHRR
ncbi:hypothetical protein ABIA96_006041 [Bradyrhizobium sp. LB11.1]